MNLKEAWEHHQRHSTKLSDVVRQGALAGLALVWMFRSSAENEPPAFSRALLGGAVALVLGLVVDAVQYAVLSSSWERHLKKRQHKLNEEHGPDKAGLVQFAVPKSVNAAGYVLFWAKVGVVIGGLLMVLGHIVYSLVTK